MRRPPHGGTLRPGLVRPGSGYGRPPGRPGPGARASASAGEHRAWWELSTDLVGAVLFAGTPATGVAKPGLVNRPAK
ncbi:MAG: hypothetical protein ACT4PI_16365 [Actinomycetota bacterium]